MKGKDISTWRSTSTVQQPRVWNIFILCVAACLMALPLAAANVDLASTNSSDLADMSLEKLMEIEVPTVYAASKFEQKETEAPASVTVITSDDIKRFGYRTLADVLQSVAGFNVSNDRNYSFLGARGISLGDFNSRFLLLVEAQGRRLTRIHQRVPQFAQPRGPGEDRGRLPGIEPGGAL